MNLAYFFVPLIEPLGVPDGFVFEFTRSESYEEWSARERNDDCGQGDHRGPILVASLKFWRATTTSDNPLGVATLFEVARRAFPKVQTPAERPRLSVERTVVEMAVPLSTGETDPLTHAFESGLDCLRTFQRAYHLTADKPPLTLASRERMPVVIPLALRDTDEQDSWPSELRPFMLNTNVHADTRLPDLTASQLEVLADVVGVVAERRPFYGYSEGAREAKLALDRDGDYRGAVLFASMAAEVLLDDLLAHLIWEEAVRPEDAAAIFDAAFLVSRVKREYQARIGGNWAMTGRGAVATWSERLARVRNRIMHAGYEPDRAAAVSGWKALTALGLFLTERMSTAAVLKRYPRTAIALISPPGLQRRGKWNRRMETLIDSTDEPLWADTFNRWRAAMNRCRAEGRELADNPDHTRAFVLRCLLPDGGAYWCAHDRMAFMAGLLPEPPPGAIDPSQKESLLKLEQAVRSSMTDEPTSTVLLDVRAWTAPATWRPEYRVVPMAGVMVTKHDLDPDLADKL